VSTPCEGQRWLDWLALCTHGRLYGGRTDQTAHSPACRVLGAQSVLRCAFQVQALFCWCNDDDSAACWSANTCSVQLNHRSVLPAWHGCRSAEPWWAWWSLALSRPFKGCVGKVLEDCYLVGKCWEVCAELMWEVLLEATSVQQMQYHTVHTVHRLPTRG
jgi:hypothetical protein